MSRQRLPWIVTLLAVVVTASSCAGDEPPPANVIEASELVARIGSDEDLVVLDVRTPEEYADGHIPGAINVPHDELGERLASLDVPLDAEIVVHCERGGRAATAGEILREGGYENVRDLAGHMQAWRAAGNPVE